MAPNVGPQCQSIIPVARVLIICVMLRLFRVISRGFVLVLDALMKMQCSQAMSIFLVDNSCVGGSQTVPHSARREPRYQNVKSLFIRLMKEVAVRPHSYLVMSFGNTETDLNRKLVVLQESWKKCGMFTQQKIVKAK